MPLLKRLHAKDKEFLKERKMEELAAHDHFIDAANVALKLGDKKRALELFEQRVRQTPSGIPTKTIHKIAKLHRQLSGPEAEAAFWERMNPHIARSDRKAINIRLKEEKKSIKRRR